MDTPVIHERCREAFRVAGLTAFRFEGRAGLDKAARCLSGIPNSLSVRILLAALKVRIGNTAAARSELAELKTAQMIDEKQTLVELLDRELEHATHEAH
jgi:hypothetical protein